MLPPILSEEMCSLKEGVDRYSYVFKIYLDVENLSVKKSELFEAIINSHKTSLMEELIELLKDI